VEADLALVGASAEDGSLERVRGRAVQELRARLADTAAAAGAAASGERMARSQVDALQLTLQATQQAQVRGNRG
jgi:hypothetical protein